jgi:hypothetical protein
LQQEQTKTPATTTKKFPTGHCPFKLEYPGVSINLHVAPVA